MKIALIGCTKKKRDICSKAIDLYDKSDFFCKELAYAKKVLNVDSVWILSAKHHLLSADTMVAPYNVTLVGAKKSEREQWATDTFKQIKKMQSEEIPKEIYISINALQKLIKDLLILHM